MGSLPVTLPMPLRLPLPSQQKPHMRGAGWPAVMRDLGLRAAAFLAFVALLAGSVWAAYAFLAVEGAEVRPLDDAYTVGAGRAFTVPYTLLNSGSNDADLRLVVTDALGATFRASDAAHALGSFEENAGWLTLEVPANAAPGDHLLEIAAVDADGARLGAATVTVRVLAAEGGVAAGERVGVWYVGRFEDGRIFRTNVQAIAEGPWPKAPGFRADPAWTPFVVAAGPATDTVPGLGVAVVGLHPGETRTVVVPPEDGYGPEWFNQTVPRDVELRREAVVPLPVRTIQRATWERHITTTGQGDPGSYAANDTFEIYDELNTYLARLVSLTPQSVAYRFELNLGEKYTFFGFWPNASEVVALNETTAVLRTTPNTEPDERFTYFRPWPNMTYVKSIDDETIVIRSDVPEGFVYDVPGAEGQPDTRLRVARLTDTEIVVETRNPEDLAGRTLVFDVTLAS